MEENDIKYLNKCRSQIARTGRLMSLFSVFAAASMIVMFIGGVLLVANGSRIDSDLPNYAQLLISFAGIGLMLLTAVLIVPLVRMRSVVRAAKEVANNSDIVPMLQYSDLTTRLWRYMTWFLIALFALGVIASAVAGLIVLSVHNIV